MNDENKTLFISGICPYCGAKLDYTEDENFVCCPVCDHAFPVSALSLPDFSNGQRSGAPITDAAMPVISSPEAALAYFDHFCRAFDWTDTARLAALSDLSLPYLSRLAEACKVAFPTDPATYALAYRVSTVVLWRAAEALDVLTEKLCREYEERDMSAVCDIFEEYGALLSLIRKGRENVRKNAKLAIETAKECGAKNRLLFDLRMDLYELSRKISALREAKGPLDIDAVRIAEERRQQAIIDRFESEGIDAEQIYQEALRNEEEGMPLSVTLKKLMLVRGYKDSESRIDELTSFFYFGNRYLEVGGKKYYTREELTYGERKSFALYLIRDGIPEKRPSLTGISRIITTFANLIFFLRDDEHLCLFDTQGDGRKVAVLNSGRPGDYVCAGENDEIFLSSDKKTFYLRKKLPIYWKKTGCLSWFFSLFRKKRQGVRNKFNNYSVLAVNMEDRTCTTVLEEVIDVMDFCGDNIFYTTMPNEFRYDVEFRVFNCKTGADRQLLNSDCVIHKVTDTQIIFSLCAPNLHNLNLYAMNLSDGETTLLERNVCDFYAMEGDRVFYTVSSGDDLHLLSVRNDGTCRRQILSDANQVLRMYGGFVYYVKGSGRNAALLKIDVNGERKTLLASHFSSIIRIGSGYVYYFTVNNEIRMVRANGTEDRLIAKDVFPENIVAGRKNVFFYRVDASAGNDNALSLYHVITDTGVIRKVAYNVRGFKEFDADTIFFSRAEQRLFRIPVLDVRDERFYKEEFREKKTVSAEIIKYGKYNKTTGEIEEVMTLGLPVISGATLLPEYGWYSREDKAARGAVYTEAHDALDEKEKQKADLRSEKREKKRQANFARRKRRADRRAARKKKRAIRKGLYPSLPRRSRYTDSLPVTNLAQRTSFGSPDLGDDLDGKI